MSRAEPDADYLAAMAAAFPCKTCGAVWTGAARCHCTSCHESFNSANAFDRHQRAGACRPPTECGLVLAAGYWQRPDRHDPARLGQIDLFNRAGAPTHGALEVA